MAKDVSDIPDSLKDALKRGRVIPFVGAGVSRSIEKKDKDSAKPFNPLFPSWKEFLVSASKKLRGEKNFPKAKDVIKLINLSEPDYLKSAEVAKNSLGTKLWNDLLNENFKVDEDKADINTLKYPQAVWKLGSNLIYTTNIDDVLEWKNVIDRRVERLDVQIDEFAELQQNESIENPTVVYLHGHISNKSSIVFTKTQYEDFYDKLNNEAKLQSLRTFLTNRTFLFLGFSLDDPYFLRQLDYIHKIYNGAASSFYVLLPEWEKDNKNIPDFVKIITFSDFGKPLLEKIDELTKYAKSNDNKSETKSDSEKTQSPEGIKKDAEKPFFNVPYRSKGDEFVGREGKKEEIWNALNKNGLASIGQAVSVKGFGGLGKTQLAVEFAHAYKDRYKNGVYWLVADSNIENQIVQIADERGWINKYDKDIDQTEVAKERFKELSECLILVDNVEAFDDVKDYLPKTDSHTHLLITSREKDGRFHEIDIDLLNRDESRKLLLRVSKRNPTDDREKAELEKILEILGDIPLAVELVGGYLTEHENVSFAKYHQYLNEVPLDALEKEFPDGNFTNHECSIIQTLRISEKTIEKKPIMFEIFKVLAWSGSSSMGVSLLQTMINAESEFAFDTALGDALKLRLIKEDETGERYMIHRLLAKIIRHEQPLASDIEWHTEKAENLENWFAERENDFKYLAEFEAEIEHLESWQEQIVESLPASAIVLTRLRGNIPYQRGNYQTAVTWSQKAFKLAESEKPDNKELKADLLNDLGLTYGDLGEHQKALEYQEKALELRKELFGEKHPSTANSYNNVGYTYGALGEHRKALEYLEKALELQKELFGEKHPSTATSYNNVGSTYGALGNYQKALEYKEKALELQKELFGEKHPDTANSYNNVGMTYGALGKHRKALEYQEKALELQKELFGEKHPLTATSYNNVGGTYGALGEHQTALEYQEKALTIYQELLGKQHPNTIIIAKNLILTYLELEDIESAGKKAAEFLEYVPPERPYRKWFEETSRLYSPKKD